VAEVVFVRKVLGLVCKEPDGKCLVVKTLLGRHYGKENFLCCPTSGRTAATGSIVAPTPNGEIIHKGDFY
jgi:hypothetical protein